jgi:hypothetical protein
MTPVITLIDAPDRRDDLEPGFRPEENQRIYEVSDPTKSSRVHKVRIRHDFDKSGFSYVIENLVANKWHRLIEADLSARPGGYGREPIPFEEAAMRAAKVLL